MGYRLTMSGPFRAQLSHHAILRLAARCTIPGFVAYPLRPPCLSVRAGVLTLHD
jgi:hypothetical protein